MNIANTKVSFCMNIINDEEAKKYFLETIADEIKEASGEDRFLAVDTEFIREEPEIPLLCLIQVASPKHSFVIDVLSTDISFLNEVFCDRSIPKIFHSARQDVEILALCDIELKNIHDTQIYEMLLSTQEHVSYQSIIKKYLGKQLEKTHVLSDWSKRPLTDLQLAYAIEDVSYLRDVYKKQQQALVVANRTGWLQDEMEILSEEAALKNTDNSELEKINSDIYKRLDAWVKNRAAEKNIDPERIVKNGIIKSISKRGKKAVHKLKNSRYVKNENTKDFFSFADEIVTEMESHKKQENRNSLFYALKTILDAVSVDQNIAPLLIATSRDLEKISRNATPEKCFSGWRMEIFGKYAKAFMNGELSISAQNSKVVMSNASTVVLET